MRKVLLLIVLLVCAPISAQDIHLSQTQLQALYLSAARCSQMAKFEAQATHRQQWTSSNAAFQTQLLSVQWCQKQRRNDEGYLGLGLQLQRDIAAQSLTNNAASLFMAYHLPSSRTTFFSAGIALGFGQRSFEPNGQWGSQYDGLAFDGTILPSMSLQNRYAFAYLDAGLGFAYRYNRGVAREKTMSKANLSFGMQHVNKPNFSFLDTKVQLQPRYTFCAQAEFALASVRSALEPLVLVQFQQPNREVMAGFTYHHYLSGGAFSRLSNIRRLSFGLYNRLQDALIVQCKLQTGQFNIACAADFTISSFSKAPQFQHAFEVQLAYLFDE